MLAIREAQEQQLSFFEHIAKEDVRNHFKEVYQEGFIYSADNELASVPQLASSMSDLIIQELFLRQLNVGDVGMFPSREECIEATNDDEKMEEVMTDANEIFCRSEMFSQHNSYMSEFEQMLIDDVILLLEELQLMYARPHKKEEGVVYTDNENFPCSIENCSIQEVW